MTFVVCNQLRQEAATGNRDIGVAENLDLEAIVSEYYADLYRFGFALAKNESDAADLTRQTFLILAKHQKQIREMGKVKTWLFTTLRRDSCGVFANA
jgi:DNA-directed RNA polymerase specialized sigma24 family protein